MKYFYEDLSGDQFEKLVVLLCQHLFGVSVQGFAKGPDGGRDAKLVGTAEQFPSKTAPWSGITIIQAKHTNGYNCSFSDSNFYSESSSSTVLAKEIPRIKKLYEKGQLNHYMLFSNRRLTGPGDEKIHAAIVGQCGIPESSIYFCGLEQLEIWLKRFPQVAADAELDPVDSPLIVSPNELAEIIEAFVKQKDSITASLDGHPPTQRVTYEQKNVLNNMTAEFAKAQWHRYLKETEQIRAFLAAPENAELQRMYESVVDEFQLKIIAHRKEYQTFDDIMNYLADLLFGRDQVLNANKRLTRAMLFYMYWNCDIGETDDAQTE
jgi:hypothetical protein